MFVELHPFWILFFAADSCLKFRKGLKNGAAQQTFGPSYFARALVKKNQTNRIAFSVWIFWKKPGCADHNFWTEWSQKTTYLKNIISFPTLLLWRSLFRRLEVSNFSINVKCVHVHHESEYITMGKNVFWNSILIFIFLTTVPTLHGQSKIQQTTMLFMCQRFSDLFLFGLVRQ